MPNAHLRLISPMLVNGTVDPKPPSKPRPNRIANDKFRGGRFYLTEAEVNRMEKAALKANRNGFRDRWQSGSGIATAYGVRKSVICGGHRLI